MRKTAYLLFILVIIAFSSCRKKTDEQTLLKPLLLTVHVPSDFFNPVLGGVIFVSDLKGAPLADTFCLGGGTYRLYGKPGVIAPSVIQATFATTEQYWHSFRITLNTWRLSPSEISVLGGRVDTLGSFIPVYKNIPSHSDAFLISTSGFSNLTSVLESSPVPLYKNPDDLFISIPQSGNVRYKWFPGLQINSIDTIDLSNSLPASSSVIGFPSTVMYYECIIKGFPGTDFRSPIPYTVDELYGDFSPVSSVTVYFPLSGFSGYHTDIMGIENTESNLSWRFHTDGPIPMEFEKIQAQFLSASSRQGEIAVEANGTLDVISAEWNFLNPYQGAVTWTLYAPDTVKSFRLPLICQSLSNMFPWLRTDSLRPAYARLYDMSGIQGYSELTAVLFKTPDPSSIDRQKTTILEYNLDSSVPNIKRQGKGLYRNNP